MNCMIGNSAAAAVWTMTLKIDAFRRALHRILLSVFVRRPPRASPPFAMDVRASPPMLARRSDPCSEDHLMSAPKRPKLPTDIRPGEGVADPGYLLAEVTELRDIAEKAGLGTL